MNDESTKSGVRSWISCGTKQQIQEQPFVSRMPVCRPVDRTSARGLEQRVHQMVRAGRCFNSKTSSMNLS